MPAQDAERVRWEVLMYGLRLKDEKTRWELVGLLQQGWEPFAVTRDKDVYDYHLRRQIDGDDDGR